MEYLNPHALDKWLVKVVPTHDFFHDDGDLEFHLHARLIARHISFEKANPKHEGQCGRFILAESVEARLYSQCTRKQSTQNVGMRCTSM